MSLFTKAEYKALILEALGELRAERDVGPYNEIVQIKGVDECADKLADLFIRAMAVLPKHHHGR
jgi:hypothetical protein